MLFLSGKDGSPNYGSATGTETKLLGLTRLPCLLRKGRTPSHSPPIVAVPPSLSSALVSLNASNCFAVLE